MPMPRRRALLRGGPGPAADLRVVSVLEPVTLGLLAMSVSACAAWLQRRNTGVEVEAFYTCPLILDRLTAA